MTFQTHMTPDVARKTACPFIGPFVRDDRGTTAVLFAIVIIPFFLMAGMALDYSRAVRAKASVTRTLDAGLLFVAREYSSDNTIDVNQALVDYFGNVFRPHEIQDLVLSATVGTDNTFTGSASGKIPTSFMQIGNNSDVPFNASSEVRLPKMEIALVLDNTGSMGWKDASGAVKIVSLRAAAHDLVNELMGGGTTSNMKIGIVPYTKFVNVGTSRQGEAWLQAPVSGWGGWNGCVGSRVAPLDIRDDSYGNRVPAIKEAKAYNCPSAEIEPLTMTRATVDTKIDAMAADGWTYIPAGLAWGWRMLSDHAPFTEGAAPSSNLTKAIILMTDGENTVKPGSPQQLNCYNGAGNITSCPSGPADTVTRALCDSIRADNVVIYTVAFSAPAGAKSLMQYCATSPANYHDAANGAGLKAAFKKIAKDLLRLRVSR